MVEFLDRLTRLVRKLTKLLIAIKGLTKIIVELVNLASNYFLRTFSFVKTTLAT